MICDLSLEALLRLNRITRKRSALNTLAITGLVTEHVDPLVEAGFLVKHAAKYEPGGQHSPLYSITDKGQELVQSLTNNLKALVS